MIEVKELTKQAFSKVIEDKTIVNVDTSNNRSLVLTLDSQEKVSLIGALNGYILYYKGDVNSYCRELEENFNSPEEDIAPLEYLDASVA